MRVVLPESPREAYIQMKDVLAIPGVTLFFEDREIPDDIWGPDADP